MGEREEEGGRYYKIPLFVSIPHAGEKVPDDIYWLKNLPTPTLMRDVDRYVDELYQGVIEKWAVESVVATCHRYVVDLNRWEGEVDQNSVQGVLAPPGSHPKGLHWSVTTLEESLLDQPMDFELHEKIIEQYYRPFHQRVSQLHERIKKQWGVVYHLDLHSMPSVGTALHRDRGQKRPQVVVSDFNGRSSGAFLKNLVLKSFHEAGFQVSYNWPYLGGAITQRYGDPSKHSHSLQVELNRSLYMDEHSKEKREGEFEKTKAQLFQALEEVLKGLGQNQDSIIPEFMGD